MKVIPACKKIILPAFLITLFGISVNNVSALSYQNNVDLSFAFNPVLAISLSSADLLIPNLTPGSSAYSNTITIGVDTNNIAGYTLSAKVGDGTTYTNDKLINSSSNTYFDNLTSSSTLANFGNNKWGYALGTISSSSTYSGLVYNTDTIINATTNASGTAATGYTGTSNTSFTIAAKASDTQASGDYKNIIIFTVVSNIVPMTINDLDYMQDFATLSASDKTSVLNSMVEGQGYSLKDKRDEKSYRIAKLADGNAWMLDNLALDIVSVSLANLKGDTNASDTTLEYLKGTHVRGDNYLAEDTNYPTAAVGYFDNNNYFSVPKIAIIGDCNSAYCVNDPGNGKWASNSITQATINNITSIIQGKIGVYYNYCAASAGLFCYGNGTSSTGSPTSSDGTPIAEDICPNGWRMPTSHTNGEYVNLYSQYSGGTPSQESAFQTALSTPLTGYFTSGEAYDQGNGGYFWSSRQYNSMRMRNLYISSNSVNPSDYGFRYNGYSVRCVVR